MKNEKVVQIISNGPDIYGLSETGKIVFFDRNSSMFVVRGSGEIKDVESNNILKCQETPNAAPVGMYRAPKDKKAPLNIGIDEEILALTWVVGILAILILVGFILFKVFA